MEAIMTMLSSTITEITNKRPNDTWLKLKLSELDSEIADINADRNRLTFELSRARNLIYRLLAGIHKNDLIGEQQP
jgi:hypothetical protein